MNNVLTKMKIGILCGGWSDERSISLNSGNSVYESLINNGYDAYIFDFKKNKFEMLSNFLSSNKIDLVFNLIHGTGGEDGTVQAWLDDIGIDYVGSDTESSRLSFSKIMTKKKWVDNELKTPAYIEKVQSIISENENQSLFLGDINKYVLKPDKSGSSVGIKIFNNAKDLSMGLSSVDSYDEFFVEEYVEGHEYTAPIIGDTVFPIIKIETKREFYDYQAKYIDDDTSFTFPEFKPDMLKKIESICLKAFQVLGCKGWGRVDFFIDKDNEISLIEINTIPGMTDHSLVPMSANHINISYIKLIEKILSQ
ncbi:MAG: D-alanine--D-alanine ligase [Gammaproteobacteria bacterium]